MGSSDLTIDNKCPLCSQNEKNNRLILVFYTVQEAFYTCENSSCPYFLTDNEGNPVKFRSAAPESKRSMVTDSSLDNIEHRYLEELLHSVSNSYGKSQLQSEYCIPSTHRCDTERSCNVPTTDEPALSKVNDFDFDSFINESIERMLILPRK